MCKRKEQRSFVSQVRLCCSRQHICRIVRLRRATDVDAIACCAVRSRLYKRQLFDRMNRQTGRDLADCGLRCLLGGRAVKGQPLLLTVRSCVPVDANLFPKYHCERTDDTSLTCLPFRPQTALQSQDRAD